MKSGNRNKIIYKEVVVVGNGPSGIILSFLLSGNIPYIISDAHPEEMLSARLRPLVGQCLLCQDLGFLSSGLEGRSTNQVSLLMDALLHPYADMGWDLEPLIEFRKTGTKIDHIVLGKGPPGGSWHRMDPQILTLSLGSWMALPGLPFHSRDSSEKRAYASNVAKYYAHYTEKMELTKNFHNYVTVNSVNAITKKAEAKNDSWTTNNNNNDITKCCGEMCEILEPESDDSGCVKNAIDCLMLKNRKKTRCKWSKSNHESSEALKKSDKKRSISFCCGTNTYNCDRLYSKSMNERIYRHSFSLEFRDVPSSDSLYCDRDANWMIESVDTNTGDKITYVSKYLVLANGGSDLPNRLEVSRMKKEPSWMLYDLGRLESNLDSYLSGDIEDIDPLLVVGAGLSAADAIIAARGRNVPVIHVFRQKSPELSRHLQENLYPEYHKVHQMMLDGGSTYPYYTAYPEYSLTDFNDEARTVIITSKEGVNKKINVSFAIILIGSMPDLSFLPKHFNLANNKHLLLDCKTNTADIDGLTYAVRGYDNLFAIGPLAGDNFVRFLSGGALAVTAELYRRGEYS